MPRMATTPSSRAITCSAPGPMPMRSSITWCSPRITSPTASNATVRKRSSCCSTRATPCKTMAWTATSGRPSCLWKRSARARRNAKPICKPRSTICGARCRGARKSPSTRGRNAFLPSRRKTCCTSSRNTRRFWNPGSVKWCASSARFRNTSIRSARPR